jgi:hypothetical protein
MVKLIWKKSSYQAVNDDMALKGPVTHHRLLRIQWPRLGRLPEQVIESIEVFKHGDTS